MITISPARAARFRSLPTIHVGQFDDQKIDSSRVRVWVSRCELGKDSKDLVTKEEYNHAKGTWETVAIS